VSGPTSSILAEPSAGEDSRSPPDRSDGPTPRRIHGIVFDEYFGVPLVAWVQPDRGSGVFSDARTGRFQLDAGAAACSVVRASAPGFEDAQTKPTHGDDGGELEFRLRSSRMAGVIVEAENGSAVPRVPVTWRAAVDKPDLEDYTTWIDSKLQRQGIGVSGETDSEGVCRLALATPAVAVITDPRTGTEKTIRIFPGQEQRVVLTEHPLVLRFVDHATREPVRGLDVAAWFPKEGESMSENRRTDDDGEVSLGATSFPVLVRRPGPSLWQSELIPLTPGAVRCGTGGDILTMIRIDADPGQDVLLIGVRACGGKISLVDERSGELVEAPVRVDWWRSDCKRLPEGPTHCTALSPRSKFRLPDQVYSATHGLLELPCYLTARSEEVPSDSELLIVTAGYAPTRIRFPGSAGPIGNLVPSVRLRPASERTLRIRHESGKPFLRQVTIYSPSEDVLCWMDAGNADGTHGPFDWYGGKLLVAVGGNMNFDREMSEAELIDSEVPTLVIPNDTGSIMVEDIPDGAIGVALIAKLGHQPEGKLFRPTVIQSSTCRFDALPAGSYLVGPESWVRGAEMQSMDFLPRKGVEEETRPMRTDVVPGKTTVISWINLWAAGQTIEGRVRVDSAGRIAPFLVPLYGPVGTTAQELPGEVPRMVFGRRSPRIELDRDGRYRILPAEPVPRFIAICATDETAWGEVGKGLHVLEVIAPGESVDIPTGSVELHWKGAAHPELIEVIYEIPVESLRYPLKTFHARSANWWAPNTPMRLDGIPVRVRELEVQEHVVPIELKSGTLKRIEIDLEKLPLRRG